MNTPFPPIISRNMFLNILKFFHCCDEDEYIPGGEPGYDPLVKMGTVYTEIAQRFSERWTCRKHIAIDEGSIPFKGRVHFKCFNPSKPDKYHLKTFSTFFFVFLVSFPPFWNIWPPLWISKLFFSKITNYNILAFK